MLAGNCGVSKAVKGCGKGELRNVLTLLYGKLNALSEGTIAVKAEVIFLCNYLLQDGVLYEHALPAIFFPIVFPRQFRFNVGSVSLKRNWLRFGLGDVGVKV